MPRSLKARNGQVMILTILALGGTLLGATTVAGLLTLHQIRAATDAANSTKAIFAADAGVEWGLYNFSCANGGSQTPCPAPPLETFSNGASVRVACYDEAGAPLADCADPAIANLRSIGSAGGSSRAFDATF